MENNTLCNRHSLGVNNHTKMYVTYTRIYGWSDYGGESSYQPGYRLENMMWMTLLVYDYIIPGDKFISYNPMPETKPYPRAKPKVRVLSKEKLKVFLEAASKNPWYLEILLGLFCGLRKEFTVTEYAVIERNPKTENSYRILRVPKVVMQEVKRRQQLIELRKTDSGIEYKNFDYVCCQENGEPRSLTAMNQALTKICNRNGLPNITVHGLRHMFATILIELGVPLFKISGLLGHSSVHTTYEYYCEIMDEQDKIIAFVNNTFVPQRTGTEG